MILFRYLAKEIIITLIAVTAVLLVIFLSNQVIHYLNDAASGKIASSVLVRLIGLQIPYLLGLLLPIGLFFGVLIVLSRLYVDNEMSVLFACGMSRGQLLSIVMLIAVFVAIIAAILTLILNPVIMRQKDKVMSVAAEQALVSSLLPGSFRQSDNGRRVYYVEKAQGKNHKVENLFMAEMPQSGAGLSSDKNSWTVVSAKTAAQEDNKKTDSEFFVAHDGYRYEGTPGKSNYLIVKFDKYGVRINNNPQKVANTDEQAQSTWRLLTAGDQNLDFVAELQWRISIPLVVLILALLAVPLSQVKPRQGKYAQLLPAVLICIFYVNLLFVARSWVDQGKVSPLIGLWWVHILVLVIALGLFVYQRWRRA